MTKKPEDILGALSYRKMADFWDRMYPVDLSVELETERFYFSVESDLATRILEIAHGRGISA